MCLSLQESRPRDDGLFHSVSSDTEHFGTWLELARVGQFEGRRDHHTPKPFLRQKYLECGIFAHALRPPAVTTAGMTTSSPSAARAVESALQIDAAAFIHRLGVSLTKPVQLRVCAVDGDAQVGEGSQIEPDWGLAAQPAANHDVDQRVSW